jgi:uncharacterized protein YukJ
MIPALRILKEAIEATPLTQKDIDSVKNALIGIYKSRGFDLVFSRHFVERVNDHRNGKQITVGELITILNASIKMHGKAMMMMPHEAEGVIKDANSKINLMIAIEHNARTGLCELRTKSCIRKANFRPNNPRDKVFNI